MEDFAEFGAIPAGSVCVRCGVGRWVRGALPTPCRWCGGEMRQTFAVVTPAMHADGIDGAFRFMGTKASGDLRWQAFDWYVALCQEKLLAALLGASPSVRVRA